MKGELILKNTRSRLQGCSQQPDPSPCTEVQQWSSVWGWEVQETLPSHPGPLSAESLEHSTYQKKPRAMEGAGRLGLCTRGGGEQSLGQRLCQKGVAHTALKHSASGGLGKG